MKKFISIIRIAILFALSMFAVLFLLGEEQDENLILLLLHIVINKAIAIGVIIRIGRLYRHWSKIDPWLMAYEKMCDEVMK